MFNLANLPASETHPTDLYVNACILYANAEILWVKNFRQQCQTLNNFPVYSEAIGGETGDHVAIHTNGMEPNNAGYQYRKANYYTTSEFDDGKIHHARIRYKNKKMEVFLDQQKVLEYAVDLAATLGLNGSFYTRITASTGSAWQTHELGYWSWKNL